MFAGVYTLRLNPPREPCLLVVCAGQHCSLNDAVEDESSIRFTSEACQHAAVVDFDNFCLSRKTEVRHLELIDIIPTTPACVLAWSRVQVTSMVFQAGGSLHCFGRHPRAWPCELRRLVTNSPGIRYLPSSLQELCTDAKFLANLADNQHLPFLSALKIAGVLGDRVLWPTSPTQLEKFDFEIHTSQVTEEHIVCILGATRLPSVTCLRLSLEGPVTQSVLGVLATTFPNVRELCLKMSASEDTDLNGFRRLLKCRLDITLSLTLHTIRTFSAEVVDVRVTSATQSVVCLVAPEAVCLACDADQTEVLVCLSNCQKVAHTLFDPKQWDV